MDKLIIHTNRDAYCKNDIIENGTMTVGELKEMLEEWDEETPVILSFDNGYTYGALKERNIECDEEL